MLTKYDFITTAQVLQACREENRAALVGFLPAGFPNNAAMVDAAITLIDNGLDILEVGIPYSDPVMDGPTIQAASALALEQGFKVPQIFNIIEDITDYVKKNNKNVAVVVMTYWNPVLRYGPDRFSRDLARAGGAGLITPDLNIDEAGEWIETSDHYGLDRIFLVAPSSSPQRIAKTAAASRGFVYAAAAMSVTGRDNTAFAGQTQDLVNEVRRLSDKYVCVGIGITTAKQARQVAHYADGIIVGSTLVKALSQSLDDETGMERLAVSTQNFRKSIQR